jgi:hypothetical protein
MRREHEAIEFVPLDVMAARDTSRDDGRDLRFVGNGAKAVLGMEGTTLAGTVMVEPTTGEQCFEAKTNRLKYIIRRAASEVV